MRWVRPGIDSSLPGLIIRLKKRLTLFFEPIPVSCRTKLFLVLTFVLR